MPRDNIVFSLEDDSAGPKGPNANFVSHSQASSPKDVGRDRHLVLRAETCVATLPFALYFCH